MIKKSFFIVLFLLGIQLSLISANTNFTVVIDAGHGGKDAGAVRGKYKEKNLNLQVALALGRMIENNCKDVKVIYTRKTDVFVDLYKRSNIANKAKANLFISIHTNSTASKVTKAAGSDTYILGLARSAENLDVAKRENSVVMLEDDYTARYEGFDPNSPESNILFQFMTNTYMDQSLQFATHVQNGLRKVAKRVDRGVSQAGFLVLRESGMPSVLIEMGFINNPAEAEFLASSAGQQKMAQAIFSGFKKYKENFDKRRGVTIRSTNKENTSPTNVNKSSNTKRTNNATTKKNTIVKNNVTTKKTTATRTTIPTPSRTRGIEYRIQFLTASQKYSDGAKALKGLSPTQYYIDKGVYKYTYGAYATEAEAMKYIKTVRAKFRDAFVVKFVNGVRQ